MAEEHRGEDRQLGQRMTRQRRELLSLLREAEDHPTADELHRRLRERLPKVSLATVYRNLDLLVSQGQARVLDYPDQPRRYDGDLEHHYHLRCTECGSLQDVPWETMPDIASMASAAGIGHVLAVRVQIDGLCRACKRGAS